MANQWGYDPNMAMDPRGFTVGQALSPNYLRKLMSPGGEVDSYYEDIVLDPNDLEGSFLAKTGISLRRALQDVAPGYQQPGTIDMNAFISPSAMRAPAKDEGIGPLMLMAPAIGGIIAAAAGAGGAAGLLGGEGLSMDFPLMSNSGGSIFGSGASGAGTMDFNLEDFFSSLDDAQSYTNGQSTDFWSQFGSGEIGDAVSQNGLSLFDIPFSKLLPSLLGGSSGLSKLFSDPSATGGLDWGKILGGLMGYKMTNDLADKYFANASAIADKYKRPWDEWLPVSRQMRDDPSGWLKSNWSGWANQVTDEAARKAGAAGFNNSGSGVNQIADTVLNRSAKDIFNPTYQSNLQAAGLFQSPSTAAGIEGDLTSKGLGMVNNANSNLGFAAREATSGVLGGSRGFTDDIYNNIMKTFFS